MNTLKIILITMLFITITSCDNNSNDLQKDDDQTQKLLEEKLKYESEIVKKIDGNIYLLNSNSKEGEVRIKLHSINQNEYYFKGVFKGDILKPTIEGMAYGDSLNLPYVLSWDTLQQLVEGYKRTNAFKILNDSSIVGLQDYMKGYWNRGNKSSQLSE